MTEFKKTSVRLTIQERAKLNWRLTCHQFPQLSQSDLDTKKLATDYGDAAASKYLEMLGDLQTKVWLERAIKNSKVAIPAFDL